MGQHQERRALPVSEIGIRDVIEITATHTIGIGASGLHYHGRDPTKRIETGTEKATSRPVTTTVEAEAVVRHEEIDHRTSAVRLAEK